MARARVAGYAKYISTVESEGRVHYSATQLALLAQGCRKILRDILTFYEFSTVVVTVQAINYPSTVDFLVDYSPHQLGLLIH